ncbi:PREDICTED: calcium-binding protein CML24-like [Nicotiana attenuata]|uniref:Calcium-binding protein cml24 n=1 Tax=Nicotiana attenuata TaxID=49451 RepID=A0A314KPT8_NICAT|nr:PREDICTED: calcium-binding protein CML24-like [Nicotiana attenuata]OIT31282.1 calcium-binding protein cml24 [Nicotiana attenuata]
MAKTPTDSKEPAVSTAEMDEVAKVFRKFDTNGDGKISLSELGAILNALGSTTSPDEVKRIMLEVDTDGDGFIDLKEFAAFHCPGGGTDGDNSKELREAFDLYDKDKNGKITAAELHSVMKNLGEKCSLKDCRRMISSVDVDGDGCVNFEEFKKMMSRT